MAKRFFVTGTDTEVGKTYVSCALLAAAANAGKRTIGLKPVAAGGEIVEGRLVNEDAIALQAAATELLPYEQVNPVILEAATSPHIAAHLAQRKLSVSQITGIVRGAMMRAHDFALVEGAGGWRVPISPRETMADMAQTLSYPVILVVGMRLGCINHALLSAEAIQKDGLHLAAWVANTISAEPMAYEQEYLATLQAAIPAPLLGQVPYGGSHDGKERLNAAEHLDIACLNL